MLNHHNFKWWFLLNPIDGHILGIYPFKTVSWPHGFIFELVHAARQPPEHRSQCTNDSIHHRAELWWHVHNPFQATNDTPSHRKMIQKWPPLRFWEETREIQVKKSTLTLPPTIPKKKNCALQHVLGVQCGTASIRLLPACQPWGVTPSQTNLKEVAVATGGEKQTNVTVCRVTFEGFPKIRHPKMDGLFHGKPY